MLELGFEGKLLSRTGVFFNFVFGFCLGTCPAQIDLRLIVGLARTQATTQKQAERKKEDTREKGRRFFFCGIKEGGSKAAFYAHYYSLTVWI